MQVVEIVVYTNSLMTEAKLNKEEVTTRFVQGMHMFENGMPQPTEREQRIESLGWRHAKKAAIDLELALESVVEAYCERGYQNNS